MEFYAAAQAPMDAHLRAKYPRQDGEDVSVYNRAINARKFDVLRAFLPAGATTNLSWHTDLRQAADHLQWLLVHPDPQVAQLADTLLADLSTKYPSSFARKVHPESHVWRAKVMREHNYIHEREPRKMAVFDRLGLDMRTNITAAKLGEYAEMLAERPKGAELPRFLDQLGQIESAFLLDFGSFRDLQRHRNGVVRMPLLTPDLGFHHWYLNQMPDALAAEAVALITAQTAKIRMLPVSNVQKQPYCAMGYRVLCYVMQTLPAYVYRIELRTSPSVHPTLRSIAQMEARWFAHQFPQVALYADMSPDTWDLRRGKQTIIEK